MLEFSHVALTCKDPIATERFYSKHFGFQRARVVPLGKDQVVFLKMGNIYLELFASTMDAPTSPAGGSGPEYASYRHIAFKVDDVDAKLAQMGADAKILLGPANFDEFIPGWRSVWIADPDGNSVEISQGFVDQVNPPGIS